MTDENLSAPSFGELLRRYREEAKLSQEKLAELVELSNGRINQFETRKDQLPKDRKMVVDFIRVLEAHGGIKYIGEADALLELAERPSLKEKEIEEIFRLEFPEPERELEKSDQELADRYIDHMKLLRLLQQMLRSDQSAERLLVIQGEGGIGKSALLSRFRQYARSNRILVALARAKAGHTPLLLLEQWVAVLLRSKVSFPKYIRMYALHKDLQARSQYDAHGDQPRSAGWSSLNKIELELEQDPLPLLTQTFLSDLFMHKQSRPNVLLLLMLDNYEHMTEFDEWLGKVLAELVELAVVVIAGQTRPGWNSAWPRWREKATVRMIGKIEGPLLRALIQKYHKVALRVEPSSTQIDAIVTFAQGLPLAAVVLIDSVAALQCDVTHLESVIPQVSAELARRLMNEVLQNVKPALEAVAVVREFDRDLLRTLLRDKEADDLGSDPLYVLRGEKRVDLYDELQRFSFIDPCAGGFALGQTFSTMLNLYLRANARHRFQELHGRASLHFQRLATGATASDARRYALKRIYHAVCADEAVGIQEFRESAERFVRGNQVEHLRELLTHATAYPVDALNRLWCNFYEAELASLEGKLEVASYQEIIKKVKDGNAEVKQPKQAKLLGYARSSLGNLPRLTPALYHGDGLKTSRLMIEESILLLAHNEPRNALNYLNKGEVLRRLGETDEARLSYEEALSIYRGLVDRAGIASALTAMVSLYGGLGDWRQLFAAHNRAIRSLNDDEMYTFVHSNVLGNWAIGWCWAGRYAEAERNLLTSIQIRSTLGDHRPIFLLTDLAYVVGCQGRYPDAMEHFATAEKAHRQLSERKEPTLLGLRGYIRMRSGDFVGGSIDLEESYRLKLEGNDLDGLPEVLCWLGQLHEIEGEWGQACDRYQACLKHGSVNRIYFQCTAYVGLARTLFAQQERDESDNYRDKAEKLAQQYEYNDLLAAIRLHQGHAAWETSESSLVFYQQALIYALRYNRFLLDEVLANKAEKTLLRSIIQQCKSRENGKELLTELYTWWTDRESLNAIVGESEMAGDEAKPRRQTTLLAAERAARDREPGDRNSPVVSVDEQLNNAIVRL